MDVDIEIDTYRYGYGQVKGLVLGFVSQSAD